MLDLNTDAVSVDSSYGESDPNPMIEKVLQSDPRTQRDDSGTSISSVVNADEAPASAGDADSSSTINFDIFNKPKCSSIGNRIENLAPSSDLVTRQFFPVAGVERNEEFSSKLSSTSSLLSPQQLYLSVPKMARGSPPDQLRNFEERQPQPGPRKSRRGPRSRSSQYRGVTFYRRTGRWESHIWDSGKQLYLGGFDTAHAAARAYDRAAVKFRGVDADINFNISDYEEDLKQMKDLTKEEFVHILRRHSTGFSRGTSKYRGVTLHKCGRWEARMGQFLGKKAYDKAAIECNGREAVTNFDLGTYEGEVSLVPNGRGADKGQNVDLNLGISLPSNGLKGNENIRDLNFHDAALQFPDRKRVKVEVSAPSPMGSQVPHGLTMSSKHLPILLRMHPSFTPNYEERGIINAEAEVVPQLGFSNWTWQANSNGGVAPVPVFSSAASSGFLSTTPISSSSHKINPPAPANKTFLFYNHKF